MDLEKMTNAEKLNIDVTLKSLQRIGKVCVAAKWLFRQHVKPYQKIKVHEIIHISNDRKTYSVYLKWIYRNFKLSGIVKHWYSDIPNPKLFAEVPYKNGVLHGVVVEYYRDGKLLSETDFVDGRILGDAKRYGRNGAVVSHDHYFLDKEGYRRCKMII